MNRSPTCAPSPGGCDPDGVAAVLQASDRAHALRHRDRTLDPAFPVRSGIHWGSSPPHPRIACVHARGSWPESTHTAPPAPKTAATVLPRTQTRRRTSACEKCGLGIAIGSGPIAAYMVFFGLPGSPLQFEDYAAYDALTEGSDWWFNSVYAYYKISAYGLALSGKLDANGKPYIHISPGDGQILWGSLTPVANSSSSSFETYLSPSFTPGGVAFDASGNFYVADDTFSKVWKVTPAGTAS